MQIRKVVSAGVGALMAGMTLAAPALAASLEEFPTPFISGGEADFVVVVGADAKPADTLSAADITATLGGLVSTGTTTTTSSDVDSEDISIGDNISTDFGATLNDNDLSFLADSSVAFDGSDIDFSEVVALGEGASNDVVPETSLTATDDDYGSDVYIEVDRRGLGYYYVFDETINLTAVDSDTTITIDFLGQTLVITDVVDNDTLTAEVGTRLTLNAGESATVNGKSVELVRTGSSSALVSVDGVQESIANAATETVNGIEIKVDSIFDDEGVENDLAVLIAGTDAEKTYNDGDAYIGEDETDPQWVWELNALLGTASGDVIAAGGPTLGVVNDFVLNDEDGDTGTDPTTAPWTAGTSIEFPNGYVVATFNGLKPTGDPMQLTFEFSDSIDADDVTGLASSEDGFVLKAGLDEGIVLTSSGTTTEVETVYFIQNQTAGNSTVQVVYLDDDNDQVLYDSLDMQGNTASYLLGYLNHGDTTGTGRVQLYLDNVTGNDTTFIIEDAFAPTTANLTAWMGATAAGVYDALGNTSSDDEAAELVYAGTSIGSKDEDHRTQYGIIVENPENNGNSDKVTLWIPSDEVEATITFAQSATAGTTTTTTGVITSSVTKLDTEVVSASETNMILVGGPCVNDLVAQLAESGQYPYTCDSFPQGGYGVHLVEDAFADGQVAMVVAGWTAADTRAAAGAVQNYATTGMTGMAYTQFTATEETTEEETA